MAYRRPADTGVYSSRWRLAHRAQLTALGIPERLTSTDKAWRYVLDHGEELGVGWDSSLLSKSEAQKLLAFLEPVTGPWCDLVRNLQRQLGAPKTEK